MRVGETRMRVTLLLALAVALKESGDGVQRDRSVYKFCLEYKLQHA